MNFVNTTIVAITLAFATCHREEHIQRVAKHHVSAKRTSRQIAEITKKIERLPKPTVTPSDHWKSNPRELEP